jgi:hypothetical protein
MNNKNNKGYTNALVIFALIILIVSGSAWAQPQIFITDGLCDARNVDFSSKRIALTGHWNYFPEQLLGPSEAKAKSSSSLIVPSVWNDQNTSNNGSGYGTYYLKLLLPENPHHWALEIPQLYNSYVLFINDSLYARNGTPGETKEQSQPQWLPQTVSFSATTDTIYIVLQLSNFHHHIGGIREPIHLGTDPVVRSHFKGAMISTFAEVIVLTVLLIYFLFLFAVKDRGRIALYFALLCLSWALRELFSDLYPINSLFSEINWFLLVRTEYITLFLIMIFATLFVNSLFADLSSQIFKYLVVFINIVFILFTLFTSTMVFTRWLPLYLIAAFVTLLYAAVLIVRALILDKTGAWFLIIGLALAIITVGYDLIAYKGLLANNILIGSISYCFIYVCSAIGLLQHLKIIKSADASEKTLTYKDLYK